MGDPYAPIISPSLSRGTINDMFTPCNFFCGSDSPGRKITSITPRKVRKGRRSGIFLRIHHDDFFHICLLYFHPMSCCIFFFRILPHLCMFCSSHYKFSCILQIPICACVGGLRACDELNKKKKLVFFN